MSGITLETGFVFDTENLYGPGKITEEELRKFSPVYTEAHNTVMNIRKTGIVSGHLSKDGEPEPVLYMQLPYIAEGKYKLPETYNGT